MADRRTKERKLVALMVNDLGAGSESDAAAIEDETHALSDEELDRTLAGRLDLPYPVEEEVLERALARVEEPEELSEQGSFTGAPDMSHDPRPEEREG
jgi:predicted nucleic acid-binding protein